jgi:glycosyltransferase involved in cell wall biosynthesis
MSDGISVVICSYNGARRLPATLAHLKAQEGTTVPWEVLLVDNASTDRSAEVTLEYWGSCSVPLRVVREPKPGVRYARERGLAEAQYEFLGFIDDDNWAARDWVATAYQVLSNESSLGAVGSVIDPVCEIASPEWFDSFHSSYAVFTKRDLEKLQEPPRFLPTAGLCLRKAAWKGLVREGFRFQLQGRRGTQLSSGEDLELTHALRLHGWSLRVEPRLRLQHFMPAPRLSWNYLRRLHRSNASSVMLDAYTDYNLYAPAGLKFWFGLRWWCQIGKSLTGMVCRPKATLLALYSTAEGRYDVIEIEELFGRVLGFLQFRGRYGVWRDEVRRTIRGRTSGERECQRQPADIKA